MILLKRDQTTAEYRRRGRLFRNFSV